MRNIKLLVLGSLKNWNTTKEGTPGTGRMIEGPLGAVRNGTEATEANYCSNPACSCKETAATRILSFCMSGAGLGAERPLSSGPASKVPDSSFLGGYLTIKPYIAASGFEQLLFGIGGEDGCKP